MIKSNLPILLAERRLKVADLIRMTDISKSTMHKIYNDQTTRIDRFRALRLKATFF